MFKLTLTLFNLDMNENAFLETESKLLDTSENKINLLVSFVVSTCPWDLWVLSSSDFHQSVESPSVR